MTFSTPLTVRSKVFFTIARADLFWKRSSWRAWDPAPMSPGAPRTFGTEGEGSAAVTAPEMITVIAPPSPTDGRYETLFDGYARVALYGYNDILIRRETEGLDIDEGDINGRYAAYLSIDGWTPLGSGPGSPPPRVIVYGASPHYHLLKLATSARPRP